MANKKYFIVLDTETAPCVASNEVKASNMFVYDLGFAVIDKHGNVYHAESLVIADIFYGESDLMTSAYYASKLPAYEQDIIDGTREVVSFYEARKRLTDTMARYGVDTIIAHNARFDYGTLNNTERWLTKSKYRYFLPYGTKVWDTMLMASDTICKQATYRKWAASNGAITKTGQVRKTAEALYRYISGDWQFKESHTALEDVLIEKEIFVRCVAQHKKMRRDLFPSPVASN